MMSWLKNFWQDEEGLGTLEILLIVAVLVGVALMFRKAITDLVTSLLDNLKTGVKTDIPN